jgi:hypothetical protein
MVSDMREKKMRLSLNTEEKAIVMNSLIDLRNRMIEEGRYTDCVDDVILKVVQAPVKRVKK